MLGEAYGPVVLKPKGGTWRTQGVEGGGCLYDYAAHAINLINWYLGEPTGGGGHGAAAGLLARHRRRGLSARSTSTAARPGSSRSTGRDESYRKMTTRITIWGTAGRIFADRQECQVYLREHGHDRPTATSRAGTSATRPS